MRSKRDFLSISMLFAAQVLGTAIASPGAAQTPHRANPEGVGRYRFEVATIKPVDTKGIIMVGTDIDPGGIVKLHGLPLKTMVAMAFNVQYWQLQGGEPWMEKTRYEVVGKPPDAVAHTMPNTRHTLYSISDPRLREMLQALLIERFALKVHFVTRPGKVYLLERTSGSLALKQVKGPPSPQTGATSTFGSIGFAAGRWVLFDVTMPEVANYASEYVLHRPVVDRTGMNGAFLYEGDSEDPNTPATDPSGSFLRLLKQIGLKLEPSNGTVEELVIDHAVPASPN